MGKWSLKVVGVGLILLLVVGVGVVQLVSQSQALDPIEEIEKEKDELEHLLQLSAAATAPLESQVKDLDGRIKKAQQDIKNAQNQVSDLGKSIDKQELALGSEFEIFSSRVAQRYKRKSFDSPLLIFLANADAVALTRELMYRSAAEDQDNILIHQTGEQIKSLEQQKANLEATQKRLASLQAQLDTQAGFFRKEIQGAKAYQQNLAGQIAALTAKQQDILNARSGTFTTSVGDVPLADDFNASIAFKAQAPSNTFAVFSFGAYTHRNGMSQYGAKARAESGQSVEDILKAYYPNATLKKDYPEMSEINVQGYGKMSFEDRYLQGIAEMPSSWNINALKAQAIAARTFAIKHTNNGSGSICTTEACQVFRNSRKGGDWEKAVNETKGWVLVDGGGQAVSTQYASTHGGFSNTGGWDTTDGTGGGSWSSKAWESKANSPWFYKAWYTQAYSVNSAKCGRNHPWLSQEEFSDIVNAWLVRKNPNGADVGRIVPVTINQCSVGGGGNPYSMDELRNLANGSGGAVTRVLSVTVSNSGAAQTANVHLDTNRGTIDIPGSEFKTTFNLRAPGYMSIPQKSFAFFNVEYKQ